MMTAMRLNLSFVYLYNMVIASLEIESFEYYYLFPLLKEILNYWGYTSRMGVFKKMAKQAITNRFQLAKWSFFFHIYYNNFYIFNNSKKEIKKKLVICSQLRKNIYFEKYITNQINLLKNNNNYLYEKEKFQEKIKDIYIKKTKKLSEISLFFLKTPQKRIKEDFRFKVKNNLDFSKFIKKLPRNYFLHIFFKTILVYKKWKADELYIKMAHIAYCENLLDFSVKLFKIARFEKQMFFFLNSYFKDLNQ